MKTYETVKQQAKYRIIWANKLDKEVRNLLAKVDNYYKNNSSTKNFI